MADSGVEPIESSLKKSKIDSTQTLTLNLPDHILIEEILARLPVKSLIRFKSVCKYWLSIISSRKFAKSHLKFSVLRLQFLFLPYCHDYCGKGNGGNFLSLPYKESCSVKDLVRLGCGYIEDFPVLVGSCHGLICVCDKEEYAGKFGLWNPATEEHREITNPDNIPDVKAYGFGYVSSIDDYKIASTFATRSGKFRGFYVFSARNGKWKRIVGKFDRHYHQLAISLDREALFVDGTHYWPTKRFIGFNLDTEKFEESPLRDDLHSYKDVKLFKFKGCLTFRGRHWKSTHNVWDFWMLKKPNGSISWEKLFTFDLTNVSFFRFSETDKCLVRQFEQFKLIDPCKEALELVRGDSDFSNKAVTMEYTESLVSPFVITKTVKQPIVDNKLLQNKRVLPSDFEEEEEDDNASEFEEAHGNESDSEDNGKVNTYWVSSDDDDKDSDYFKYALSNDEDEDDDEDEDEEDEDGF
ncbi:hypothetical protein SOVF_187030 isoform A [Spinacia oleracea]|nr:hypothetical protein SOVF_187030 isoform A [Spinacia oleracea]